MNVKTIKELIRYQKELALMNGVQLTSWEALGYGISSTTKKMLKWLVTNPAGWAILATTAITSLVKGYDALIGRQEKLARTKLEDLDEDISKYDEEIQSLEELQSKLESAKGNKSELAQIQNELNDAIGETTGLLNGEGKAYDIANAKLKANIELKKKQREQAQKDKIKEKKNLFDDNVYEDGSSWFNTDANSMRWYAQKYQELIEEYENALDDSDIKKMYGSAEDYAFGWLNINAGAGIKESTWADYWDEQVQTAYDIFEDTIEDYDGVGGQDFIKNIINNMVRCGSDLSQISDVIFDIINNQDLQDKINEYWASLVDPKIDSEKALNAVKTMIDGIIKQYPQLEAFFTDFYDGIVSGANVVADTVTDTANKIDVSLDAYKKASEGISSLATAFKELTDDEYISLETISKIKEAVGDSIPNWEAYEQKLLSVKKGTAEYNQLMSELTYATLVKQLGGVNALAQADEKYVTQLLKENGVLNANKVAKDMIASATAKSNVNLDEETSAIIDNVEEMYKSGEATKLATGEMLRLIIAEKIFNNQDLTMSGKVDDLETLAKAFGITSAAAETAKKSIENVDTVRRGVLAGTNSITELVGAKKQAERDFKAYTKDILGAIDVEFGRLTDVDFSGNFNKNNTKETFDWIETKISRLQRTITNLGKTVSDTFKSWSTRNKSLTSEISTITSAINEQKKATKEYKKQADNVKLSSSYKKKVRNGAIDIDTIKDDKTKANIKLYQEYYNKYLESLDAENELQANLNQKYKERFDLVKKQYEDELSLVENDITDYANRIDLSEAQGKQIKSSHYTQMIELQNTAVSKLQSQYNALQKELNSGKIKKGSEEWYALQNEIDQVKHSLDKAKISLEEYKQSQREADWDIFDDKQQKKSNFTSDNDFLLGLLEDEDMYDDNGNITKYGKSSNALHAINLDTHIQQAKDYATAISDLDKQYANDKNNSFYLERRRDLVEAQQEAINNAKDEQQAMIDLAREGYDALLDSMQKIIDKHKKMLSEIKNTRNYEKSIREQTDEISVIQKQLISYQGDDSEEARAAIQRLQKSLKDAEENLEETQYDKFIQDQEQLYDDLMEDTQTWVNELFENESTLLEQIAKTTAESGSLISETIKSLASNMGYNISGDLSNTLKNKGYAKGSKNIPYDQINWIHKNELLYRASDGGLLMPLGSGDKVFTKEMSDRLWDIAQIGFKPVLSSMPNMTLNGAGNNNGNGDITFDIKMYGVNDPQEFAQQLKEVYDRDIGNVRKMINTDVHSKYGSMNYRRYL